MSVGKRFARAVPRLTRRAWEDVASQLEDFLNSLRSNDLGVPGGNTTSTPETVRAGTAAATGDESTGWATGNHNHAAQTATASALSGLSTSQEGVSTSLARADHSHGVAQLVTDISDPLQAKHGFEVSNTGTALVTLSYNASTRVVTVTPTGASFVFYIDGVKHTKTGAQAAPAHDNTTGKHFIYYDSNGALQKSTTAWNVVDRTVTPVALVYYYQPGIAGVCYYECHTADRWLEGHRNLHLTRGTAIVSGFALSGYTLNTDSDAGVTYAIASGIIADEDLQHTLTAVSDGGPYTIWYRTGAAGDWTWDSTPTLPFMAGTTYPQWNQNVALTGWQLTELSGIGLGEWTNYYIVGVPGIVSAQQILLIAGQAKFTSLASATNETISSISWGTLPFEEIAPLWRVTVRAVSTYGGTKKARIESVTAITAGGASITQVNSPSVHNSLSGRDATDAHPAAAITFTPYSTLASTTVQAAIQELLDEGGSGSGGTVIKVPDANPTSPSAYDDEFNTSTLNAKWTAASSGITYDIDTRRIGKLWGTTTSGTDYLKITQSYAPAGACSITAKIWNRMVANYNTTFIILANTDETDTRKLASTYSSGHRWEYRTIIGGAAEAAVGSSVTPSPLQYYYYLHLQRGGSNNWNAYASNDCVIWQQVGTAGVTHTFTIAKIIVGIYANGGASAWEGGVEWIRADWLTL